MWMRVVMAEGGGKKDKNLTQMPARKRRYEEYFSHGTTYLGSQTGLNATYL